MPFALARPQEANADGPTALVGAGLAFTTPRAPHPAKPFRLEAFPQAAAGQDRAAAEDGEAVDADQRTRLSIAGDVPTPAGPPPPSAAPTRTAMNSAGLSPTAPMQQKVGQWPWLRERQQMPTRKDVDLDAKPVTSDPALEANREEAVV